MVRNFQGGVSLLRAGVSTPLDFESGLVEWVVGICRNGTSSL